MCKNFKVVFLILLSPKTIPVVNFNISHILTLVLFSIYSISPENLQESFIISFELVTKDCMMAANLPHTLVNDVII